MSLPNVFSQHGRDWRQNLYVYPVISRRSKGLSIGVNLSPDKACNFNCIYCQVDRTTPGPTRKVDPEVLAHELDEMLAMAQSGRLFEHPPFDSVDVAFRRVNDIAFSGDGEPTACPQFPAAAAIAADLNTQHGADDAKIVLITNACFLKQPAVKAALDRLAGANLEVWAKLDAGTEEYYRRINRANYPLNHVVENITDAARNHPLVIQSLWMRVDGEEPPAVEVEAFCERLNQITGAGGCVSLVQVYTIARRPAVNNVTALDDEGVDRITRAVAEHAGLPVESYYGTPGV